MLEINYDCFRDVLQFIVDNLEVEIDEETDTPKKKLVGLHTILNDKELTKKYDIGNLYYTIEHLVWANFIIYDCIKHDSHNDIIYLTIRALTLSGQEFLDLAKQEKVWNRIKGGFKKVSGFSLEALKLMMPELIKLFAQNINQ